MADGSWSPELRRLIVILILVSMSALVKAGDCGSGLPCGPVPWNLPSLPLLRSPTPMPTYFASVTPSPTVSPTNFTPSPTSTATSTPSATFTPSATPTLTPVFDTEDLEDQMLTLEGFLDATPITIEIDGTPVSVSTQIASVGPGIEDIFGKAKGVFGGDWGPFQPLFQAFMVGVALTFLVIAITYSGPIVGFIFGMVRKIYSAIMDFIPG